MRNNFFLKTTSGYVGLLVLLVTVGILIVLFARFYFAPEDSSGPENGAQNNYSTVPSKERYQDLRSAENSAEAVQDTVNEQMGDLKGAIQE